MSTQKLKYYRGYALEDKPPVDLSAILDVLNGLPQGVVLFDWDLQVLGWNRKLLRITNIPEKNLNEINNFSDFIKYVCAGPKQNKITIKILEELQKVKTGADFFSISFEYKLENDKLLEVKGSISENKYILLTLTDITSKAEAEAFMRQSSEAMTDHLIEIDHQRQQMEQQAAEAMQMAEDLAVAQEEAIVSADRLESIMNATSDGLITLDEDANILSTNKAFQDIVGYSAEELNNRNFVEFIVPETVIPRAEFEEHLQKNDGVFDHKATAIHKNKKHFPIEVRMRTVVINGQKLFTTLVRDETERAEAEAIIRRMAMHDSLTGLANRNLLQKRLDDSLKMAKRLNKKTSVLFLDLDLFKPVNDLYGHATGDKLLQIVGQRLVECAREIDTVARLGGDEFAIILTNLDHENAVPHIADRILESIQKPIEIDGNEHTVGTSIGISFYPDDSNDPQELLRMADVALYQAKDDGRRVFRMYDPNMDAVAKAEKQMEIDLAQAIEKNELVLHYQPQLDAIDYTVVGAEALVRWEHPEKGLVPPYEFIPIAENSGLILPVGQWVMEEACRQAKQWQDDGMDPFRVSVNISARQFQSHDFVANVQETLEKSGLDPRWLELEITEGMVIDKTDLAVEKLEQLAGLGITLSIDDFGTGYSSLAYLKRFSVHQLKVDQSFVRDIVDDHDDAAITDAIIRLGHSLGLTIVAEGVETEEHIEILRQKGCDVMQGYFFSKPLPSENFVEWLQKKNSLS